MTINELPHFSKLHKVSETYKPCPKELIAKYRDVLPEIIISSWEQSGFQKFSNGFLWTVDPDEFRDIASDFLHDYQAPEVNVLFRTGFGDLILLYKSKMFHMSALTLKHGELVGTVDLVLELHLGQRDSANAVFFLKEFKEARKKLGDITDEEVYTPVPVIPMGGTFDVANMQKANLKAHLHFLSQV